MKDDFVTLETRLGEYLDLLELGDAPPIEQWADRWPEEASDIVQAFRDWQRAERALEGASEPIDRESGGEAMLVEELARLELRASAFERYDVRHEVGRGGQGVVHAAWDEDLDRVLAMKVLRPPDGKPGSGLAIGSKRSLRRFLEEARITSRLDHPGIVPVHELGVNSAGQAYFTMKLVQGEDLAAVLHKVRTGVEGWTRTRALGVLQRVCEAMAYAHAKKVVHRDLKPSNVMVGPFGEVYVMDWGLAKVVHEDGGVQPRGPRGGFMADPIYSRDGDVVGTPPYMAPEQAYGHHEKVAEPADVYAVGAILYELLAGHAPYGSPGGDTSARSILEQVREGPPAPLRARDVPPELLAICDRAMAREPAQRYGDMREMGEDLRAFLENRVVHAHRAGVLLRARKWIARNPQVAAALVLAIAVTLVGGGLVLASEWRRTRAVARSYSEHLASALVARADDLWPIHPRTIPDLEAWLELAAPLVADLDARRPEISAFEAWCRDAWTAAGDEPYELRQQRVWAAGYPEQIRLCREQLQAGVPVEEGARLEREIEIMEEEIPHTLRRVAELERAALLELGLRRAPETDRRRLQHLANLTRIGGLAGEVRERLAAARAQLEPEAGGAWSACIESVADRSECPLYDGLVLEPQLGLVPIGLDPSSGLWEFWHELSGDRPSGEPGAYDVASSTGIVLVLVPGAPELWIGAQSTDEQGRNFDALATVREGPPLQLALDPFFLSKYEMTQAQWFRLTGDTPSRYPAGSKFYDRRIDRTHPVEEVGHARAVRMLARWNLTLPTEAQWERAAVAGARRPVDLQATANVGDRAGSAAGWQDTADWSDGFVLHAPVGSFAPNPFGFHDVLGNVAEWMLDWNCSSLASTGDCELAAVVPGTGELVPQLSRTKSIRGGSFLYHPRSNRVTWRTAEMPDWQANDVGVRPAMLLQTSPRDP